MTLIVYPYIRDVKTSIIEDFPELVQPPRNDLFGSEGWRVKVWGSTVLEELNCKMLNSLQHSNIYAEGMDVGRLEKELLRLKRNSSMVSVQLNYMIESFELKVDNALEAIRLAKKYDNGGVAIE